MSGGLDPQSVTQRMRSALVSLQRAQAPDPHGWVQRVL